MSKKPKKVAKVGGLYETVVVFPPKQILTDLSDLKRNTKKRSQSIAGTLGKAIAEAVENKHLDRVAFGICSKLDAMDDERLGVTWPSILKYAADMGIIERATAQEEMFAAGEAGEPSGKFGDKDGGEGDDKNNVTTLKPQAARQAAE